MIRIDGIEVAPMQGHEAAAGTDIPTDQIGHSILVKIA
jgi:hypothetical protein